MILDDMVKQGEIQTFLDQVSIRLPATTDAGKRQFMQVDFLVITNTSRYVWLDAKGRTTPKWELQRNLAFQHHGIDVIPVYKGKPLPNLE